jgi:hypothetical protein
MPLLVIRSPNSVECYAESTPTGLFYISPLIDAEVHIDQTYPI